MANIVVQHMRGLEEGVAESKESERKQQASVSSRKIASLFVKQLQVFPDDGPEETPGLKGIINLQRRIREKCCYPDRLHRANLAERLVFESHMVVGTIRLINQIMVFALLMVALRMSSLEYVKLGIYKDLDNVFGFEELEGVGTRGAFRDEAMVKIAAQSKQFFHLSSTYFDQQERGAVQLLGDMEVFTSSKPGGRIEVLLSEFSFTAWVKIVPQYLDGYIMRKRPSGTGDGAVLSCIGWHLHRNLGMSLHYGAHDFDPLIGPLQSTTKRQYEVGLAEPVEFLPDQYSLLTMVVNETHVNFFQNLNMLGTAELPRVRLTDCFNNNEGTLIGSAGMEMGVLRFYPRALTLELIEEVHSAGGTLEDISTGSKPAELVGSDLSLVERSLSSSIASVDAAVNERQTLSQINHVLKSVSDQAATAVVAAKSPTAPLGAIAVNHTTLNDAVTGRPYYSLAKGPWYLSETTADADHRYFDNPPDFIGAGVTFSFWYRHVACNVDNCGVYLFTTKSDERQSYCWSFWLENEAMYYDNVLGTPKFQYPRDFMEDKHELNGDQIWRHLALVMDETNNMVRYYSDGALAWTGPWGSDVRGADCGGSNRRITLGRTEPGYTYGAPAEIYDLRMYVHSPNNPLQEAEILELSKAPTPEISSDAKCLPIESEGMEDKNWVDTFKHGCEWYFEHKTDFPEICNEATSRSNCPQACQSKQECFAIPEDLPTYFNWDRIRYIERRSVNGTICLSDKLVKAEVVQQCRDWNSNGGFPDTDSYKGWLESMKDNWVSNPSGRTIDVRNCDVLEEAIDEGCSFSSDQVEKFTAEVKQSNGDYTIAFWVKPLGDTSLHDTTGRFHPTMNFFAQTSPPRQQIQLGRWSNPNGEIRLFSSCGQAERDIWENVEMKKASESDWTFIAISRKNFTTPERARDNFIATNLGKNWEGSTLSQCLYDPSALYSSIEVNYPMLMSPVMMIPKALPFALLQQTYLKSASAMAARSGPVVPKREQDQASIIEVLKQDFESRTVLVAPPIVSTRRRAPAKQCQFSYSTQFIEQQHERVKESKCSPPFDCSEEVINNSSAIMACPGDGINSGHFFGLNTSQFGSDIVYADFLFSLTDNSFLYRDGAVRSTSGFLDSMTASSEVTLVFFTPELGVTSVLTVAADYSGDSSADVEVTLQHYEILEGSELGIYLFVQSLVLVSILVIVLDIVSSSRHLVMRARELQRAPSTSSVIKIVIDIGTAGMVTNFVIQRMPQKISSADDVERIVGSLSQIQWDSQEQKLHEKTAVFFEQLSELITLIDNETSITFFGVIILFVSLLRVIQCTALHPRLALLTGTLVKAADDLWHAVLLVALLMGCFAGIATWRFGSEYEEFANLGSSMNVQFMMTFGEFPDRWQETPELIGYTLLYFVIVFLLVQNFLLAIIVEAYMQVRTDNEDLETEMEFVHDVYGCFLANTLAIIKGWPTPAVLGRFLEQWYAKFSVGFVDLNKTGLFRSQNAVGEFLKFYQRYDFLEPIKVKKTGVSKKDDTVDEIERRITKLLIGHVPTLKEQADANLKAAQLRKISKTMPELHDTNASPIGALGPADAKPPANLAASKGRQPADESFSVELSGKMMVMLEQLQKQNTLLAQQHKETQADFKFKLEQLTKLVSGLQQGGAKPAIGNGTGAEKSESNGRKRSTDLGGETVDELLDSLTTSG